MHFSQPFQNVINHVKLTDKFGWSFQTSRLQLAPQPPSNHNTIFFSCQRMLWGPHNGGSPRKDIKGAESQLPLTVRAMIADAGVPKQKANFFMFIVLARHVESLECWELHQKSYSYACHKNT